jgi:ElaA protein
MMQINFQCLAFGELQLEQLYALLRLRQEVFIVEQFCHYLDADNWDQAAYHLLGYGPQEQLLAYARLLPPGLAYTDYAAIGRVIVAPAARGHQLGQQLMETALKELAALFPGRSCKLSAQSHLRAFYTGLGFQVAGEGYMEDGIPHLPMLRPA